MQDKSVPEKLMAAAVVPSNLTRIRGFPGSGIAVEGRLRHNGSRRCGGGLRLACQRRLGGDER